MQRWGRFSGRQRYRCTACCHTFSTYTGTALHYLKRIDAWPAFCQAMLESLTVGQAAALAGIHPDTAFRWRHRFLSALEGGERVVLRGQTAVGVIHFRYSRKGARDGRIPDFLQPHHPGRLPTGMSWVTDRERPNRSGPGPWIPVVFARDIAGSALSMVAPQPAPDSVSLLIDALKGRTAPDVVLRSRKGPFSDFNRCAHRLGLEYSPFPASVQGPGEPEHIPAYAHRIRGWLYRFRGVATKYLPHYLAWFRALDAE